MRLLSKEPKAGSRKRRVRDSTSIYMYMGGERRKSRRTHEKFTCWCCGACRPPGAHATRDASGHSERNGECAKNKPNMVSERSNTAQKRCLTGPPSQSVAQCPPTPLPIKHKCSPPKTLAKASKPYHPRILRGLLILQNFGSVIASSAR